MEPISRLLIDLPAHDPADATAEIIAVMDGYDCSAELCEPGYTHYSPCSVHSYRPLQMPARPAIPSPAVATDEQHRIAAAWLERASRVAARNEGRLLVLLRALVSIREANDLAPFATEIRGMLLRRWSVAQNPVTELDARRLARHRAWRDYHALDAAWRDWYAGRRTALARVDDHT